MTKFPPIVKRPTAAICRLFRDRRGATAVILALALSGIVGFAGLGSEIAAWYLTTRAMQGAVSSAASSAAAELAAGAVSGTVPSNDQLTHTGRAVSATFSFTNGVSNTTVTINRLTDTGTGLPSNCDARLTTVGTYGCYVEAIVQQQQPRLLSALFISADPMITMRAVARANTTAGDTGCVLALSGATVSDVTLNGSVRMQFSNCALYDNSPMQSGSLNMNNNATITASAVYDVGTPNQTSGITTTDGIFTGVNPAADPYASVTMPTGSSCNDNSNEHNPNATVNASSTGGTYVFCGNVTMDSNGTAPTFNLGAGVYIFACGSSLTMTSGTLNATGGVTLVFERACPGHNAASSPGVINVSGNANLNITAPTSGTTAGIAIFQERYPTPGLTTCNGSNCNSLGGGGTLNITGAAYFPNNPVSYSGGSGGGGASQCTQLIANTITFSGNATFNNNCSGTGVRPIASTNGTLVM